jgi:hypothetical protein
MGVDGGCHQSGEAGIAMIRVYKVCSHPFGCFGIVSLAQQFLQAISDVECGGNHAGGDEKEKYALFLGRRGS